MKQFVEQKAWQAETHAKPVPPEDLAKTQTLIQSHQVYLCCKAGYAKPFSKAKLKALSIHMAKKFCSKWF